jgi:hypothetical protein
VTEIMEALAWVDITDVNKAVERLAKLDDPED